MQPKCDAIPGPNPTFGFGLAPQNVSGGPESAGSQCRAAKTLAEKAENANRREGSPAAVAGNCSGYFLGRKEKSSDVPAVESLGYERRWADRHYRLRAVWLAVPYDVARRVSIRTGALFES